MRKISILLIALLAIGMMYAQQTKLGYVNTDRVLLDSNEITEITRLFQLDKQNWTNQIRTLDEEIKRLEREFEIRKLSINEATKRQLQTEIDTKKSETGRLLEEYFGENGKAEQRYRELIDPLTKKIHDIITKIAEDEKYTMILDVSMGVILYATPTIDITEQVLQELNKDTIKPSSPELTDPKPEDFPPPTFGDGFKEDGLGGMDKPEDIFKP